MKYVEVPLKKVFKSSMIDKTKERQKKESFIAIKKYPENKERKF